MEQVCYIPALRYLLPSLQPRKTGVFQNIANQQHTASRGKIRKKMSKANEELMYERSHHLWTLLMQAENTPGAAPAVPLPCAPTPLLLSGITAVTFFSLGSRNFPNAFSIQRDKQKFPTFQGTTPQKEWFSFWWCPHILVLSSRS